MGLQELDDLMDGLEDASADFADAWEPEEGDTLVGTLVRRSTRNGDYGAYEILTIEANGDRSTVGGESVEDETPLAVHAYHTVLAQEVEEQDPTPGNLVAIRFNGVAESESGREYKSYAMKVA